MALLSAGASVLYTKTMNADTLIIILALMFFAWGFLKGALREIFSLLAFAAAFFFSAPLTALLLPAFKHDLGSYVLIQSAGRVVLWFILYFVIVLIGKLVESRFLKKAALRFANRSGGAVIGFLKAAILSLALMWSVDVFISLTGSATPDIFSKSRMYKAASKKNIFMKTEKVAELTKMIALAKIAQQSLPEVPGSIPGGRDINDIDLSQMEKVLQGVDPGEIEKLLKEMSSMLPGLDLPEDMDIKKIQKLVSDMNRESVNKIRQAAK
ncbi:MAG: hypothetical protein CVU78_02740 [Elusimicrobia bacterium HGW-Elusimicrobia-2]|nr:MAG: hypothetical protein CVU78_02740 [Elusimicrobia bacterium HGW-Elusimicrobia-2]